MAVTAPETAVRMELKTLLEAEFGEEAEVRDDALHESLGHELLEGKALIGVYPAMATERANNGMVQETTIYVQIFGQYNLRIDPTQVASPTLAEERTERVRRAVEAAEPTTGQHLWYFTVQRAEYPKDPTGNITRSILTVVAHSDNSGVVETTG